MAFVVVCPGCEKKLRFEERHLLPLRDYRVTCPACQRTLLISGPERTSAGVAIPKPITAPDPPPAPLADDISFAAIPMREVPPKPEPPASLSEFLEAPTEEIVPPKPEPAPEAAPEPAAPPPPAPSPPPAKIAAPIEFEMPPPVPEPEPKPPRRMRSGPSALPRIFTAFCLATLDIATLKPFDLLADLHFAHGREWARAWKRTCFVLHLITALLLMIFFYSRFTPTARSLFVLQGALLAAGALLFWPLLGMEFMSRLFRGERGLGWILLCAPLMAFAQGWFALSIALPYVNERLHLQTRLNKALQRTARAEHLFYRLHSSFHEESEIAAVSSPSPEFVTDHGAGTAPKAPQIDVDPHVMAIASQWLRTEIPESSKAELIRMGAQVLVERQGAKTLEGKAEEVAKRLRATMIQEFMYLLRPEVLREAQSRAQPLKAPIEPKEEKPAPVSQDLFTETAFHNAFESLVHAVKWRDLTVVQGLLPAALQARITAADLTRFYAPFYSVGEIYSVAYELKARNDTTAIVLVRYEIAPYVTIDPEKVVFGSGLYTQMKQNHPVQEAQILYLFVHTGPEWKAVHYTPATAPMVTALYPDLQPAGAPSEPRIFNKDEKAPSDLVVPHIQ